MNFGLDLLTLLRESFPGSSWRLTRRETWSKETLVDIDCARQDGMRRRHARVTLSENDVFAGGFVQAATRAYEAAGPSSFALEGRRVAFRIMRGPRWGTTRTLPQ